MHLHIVTTGQTLYSVARQYGIHPGLIARQNGLREPYRLAVGQCLLILQPRAVYTVRAGDTLYAIAQRFGTDVKTLWRNNPNLSGGTTLYPGQTLVLNQESMRTQSAAVLGYAYPSAQETALRGILPYASALCPFTYGITEDGGLIAPADGHLTALALEYGVQPLLHLSTLAEGGGFSALHAQAVLESDALRARLIAETVAQMRRGGYGGVDVDFEFLGAELADAFAGFLGELRAAVHAAGGIVVCALAPKTSAEQRGVLYEGHDYRRIGENADAVLLMTYEWGYTYGLPMAVAPIGAVRRVVEYALTQIPASKILLGFPNYAYDWTLPYAAGESRARSLGNEAAAALAVQVGAEICFDEAAQTPYFSYTDRTGAAHEVWFEDPRSCAAKYDLAQEYSLRGFGFWNFMRPFTAAFALLNARFTILPGV